MINIKSPDEIKIMREGGKILSLVLKTLSEEAKSGMKLSELDRIAFEIIKKADAKPSFLGFNGYPASICTSVNHEIVHGIPRELVLKDKDILSIDVGIYYKEMHTDAAITIGMSDVSKEARNLIEKTRLALLKGIQAIKPGAYLGDISAAIQEVADKNNLGIVKDLVGHGIGRELHEYPQIPNYGRKGSGDVLSEGMALAIEPMFTLGGQGIKVDKDNWAVQTADLSLAAHFEHTVAVTARGFLILTG